mgnify:CR=1 FL=1
MKEKVLSKSPNRLVKKFKAAIILALFVGTSNVVLAQNPNANENATVYGGEITFANGETTTDLCVGDGMADTVEVVLENASGRVKQWIVTDDENNILGLPSNPSDVDFDGAGVGVCRIWHLSYNGIKPLVDPSGQGKFTKNLDDLKGKYHLSNYIEVNRIQQPEGGSIALADGSTQIEICAGDGISDLFEVTLTGADVVANENANMLWVITDNSSIYKILDTSNNNSFDLEGAGEGTCLIWHLSYAENVDLTGVEYASDITGCFDLSNPITVIRNGVNAGEIQIVGGGTEIEICAGDGNSDAFDAEGIDDAVLLGDNIAWVITDNNLDDPKILGLPPGPTFDLEGAGEGTCLIWRIAFEDGLEGVAVGNNVSALSGCYALSNAITVVRNGVNAGEIAIANDGGTEIEICAGDGTEDPIEVEVAGDSLGDNMAWVITNNAVDPEILGLPAGPPFDLEGAGEGTCLIWRIAFEDGLEGVAVGNNVSALSGCYDLSNAITVVRNGVNGGTITGGTDNKFEFVVDNTQDKIPADAITLEGNVGTKSAWVITNEDGTIILGLPANYSDVDFNAAGVGVCKIWHLSYEEGLTGTEPPTEGDHLVSSLDGCFSLSNAITVTRTAPSAGKVAIYPNPAKSIVNVDVSNFGSDRYNVQVFNMQSRQLFSKSYSKTKLTTLDVSDYEQGIYFVSVFDLKSGTKTIKRFVVE